MLDICFEYGIEHELLFNGKNSNCTTIGNLYNFLNQSIFIGKEKMYRVSECKYWGVKVCNRKYFHTTCEDYKRKFCGAANNIILNNHLSE